MIWSKNGRLKLSACLIFKNKKGIIMKISINTPININHSYTQGLDNGDTPSDYLKELLVDPLVTNGINMLTDIGDVYDADMLLNDITTVLDGNMHIDEEDRLRQIYSKAMVYGDDKRVLPFDSIFLSQAGIKEKLPEPSPTVIYKITTDIQPVVKEFLAGMCTPSKLTASFGYTFRYKTLGIYMKNETVFNDFKTMLNTEINNINANKAPADLFTANIEFQKIKLDSLTECLLISKDYSDNSFRRVLMKVLFDFTNNNPDDLTGIMPFSLEQLVDPDNIIFINLEKHANSTSRDIDDEWRLIKKAITDIKIRIIGQNKIMRLSTAMRALKKAQNKAPVLGKQGGPAAKHAYRKWTTKRPTNKAFANAIKNIIYKMKTVAMSENVMKTSKISFSKPNRRDPDNYNKPGKITSNKYYPDLHIYCDTSRSISEENYQDAITLMIDIAKKLDVNLYFNSFSHVLSKCSKINTKGKGTSAIYKSFQKIRKVTGSTDFEQIWHYINASPKRRAEMSLIITDFEWGASSDFVKHPKNLYYMPCAGFDYKRMLKDAKDFAQSAKHNDPDIRKKILM